MVTQEIRDIVIRLVDAVSTKGVHVDKALLYGSFATGKQTADSDLDIAIISNDFGRDRFSEGKMLMQLAGGLMPDFIRCLYQRIRTKTIPGFPLFTKFVNMASRWPDPPLEIPCFMLTVMPQNSPDP